MYGVVLWSDDSERKAVFWCEDHGDLAYFAGSHDTTAHTLDAGDLVEFEVIWQSKLRTALNPRVIQEKLDVDLPGKLLQQQDQDSQNRQSTNILPFSSRPSAANTAKRAHQAEIA